MEASTGVHAAAAQPAPGQEAARLKRAAGDFEALMIGELLRAARLNGSTAWLGEEDAAADSAFSLAEEHFARSLAGSLGLAGMAMEGLAPHGSRNDAR